MGVDEVRNDILRYYLQSLKQYPIEYGPTFSIGTPKEKLYKYLNTVIKSIKDEDNKIMLFTCNNSYGSYSKTKKIIETHYQTFIIQPKQKRITMIDPSRRRTQIGIYHPYAAMVVYFYIMSRINDCKFYWLNLTDPCQVDFSTSSVNDDVFCQTWSLYLQKEALLTNKNVIVIPYKITDKYEILLKFYKDILKNIKLFRDEFILTWNKYVKTQKMDLGDINILDYIMNMKSEDFYSDTEIIRVKPEIAKNYINTVTADEIDEYLLMFIHNNNNTNYKNIIDFEKLSTIQKKSPVRTHILSPNNSIPLVLLKIPKIPNLPNQLNPPNIHRRRSKTPSIRSRSPPPPPPPPSKKSPDSFRRWLESGGF
jgi:hypothetical protein